LDRRLVALIDVASLSDNFIPAPPNCSIFILRKVFKGKIDPKV
jgi:hypothetical protein